MLAPEPIIAHGPTMPPPPLLSFARPAMLDEMTPEPCRFKVAPAFRENVPVLRASVCPFVTFQIWFPAPRVSPALMVRLEVAALMSMPELPSVSVLPEVMFIAPPGLATVMPDQLKFAPSATEFAAVTVLSHTAMLPAPGASPPSQLPFKFRLFALFAFLTVGMVVSMGGLVTTEPGTAVVNRPTICVLKAV